MQMLIKLKFVYSLGEFKSVTGCENDVVQLTCNPGSRLAIYSAIYGYSGESLLCPQPHPNDIIGESSKS